ncbi:uncharacterized protein ppp1r18 [Pseudoliparis swirei]|uniref:uncharacterized protein ppp1r18 n=1 Tax=Pseudoliparis swirei TaxID=2059687 RepID=UPI0024BD87C7|nr:uncharacterized protein ppp1r18 [Pseudoliparis swirei]
MSVSCLLEWKQLLLEKKRKEEEEREMREKEEEEKFANMPAWKREIIHRRKAKQDGLGDREKERDVSLLQVDVSSASDGLSDKDRSQGREKERSRDRSQGREQERSRDRSQGREKEHNNQWIESVKDAARERELIIVRKDEEEKETDPPSSSFSPLGSCLRTIRANNIIIIEQDRRGSEERKARWREAERERPEEDQQLKRGMKMDLREILAAGGSITEIRASEVLIIQPSASPEERSPEVMRGRRGSGREDGEIKCSMDVRKDSLGRELRRDESWLGEKEKARPWGQAAVIKDDRKDSVDDAVFVEKGGRVSQLLSKFGQHPKPSRSKSSDIFLRPGRRKLSDEDDQQSEAEERNMFLKGGPKRSFSFSDRVLCGKENGLDDENARKTRESIHSDKSAGPWVNAAGLGKEVTKTKLGCTRLIDKDRFGLQKDGHSKNKDGKGKKRRDEAEMCPSLQHRSEVKKAEPVDARALERASDADGDEGFTAASVKNTEGISFAIRVAIRQEGRARAEREKSGEKSLEKETSVGKPPEAGVQVEEHVWNEKVLDCRMEEGFESTIPPETLSHAESAFTECSSLLCADRARELHQWSTLGPQGPYIAHSILSQHTEELISKIEKIGDTTIYTNEKGERTHKAAYEMTKGSDQEIGSTTLLNDATPRSPKRLAPTGIPPVPPEIQIPRSVFYVAEETVERKKAVGQRGEGKDWEGGQGVERRDSWRIGKPLSRIESLREKIRQREQEKLRQREARGGGGSEGAELNDTWAPGDGRDERGADMENEWEAAARMRKPVEAERGQEDAAAQTSTAAFDVTQEVGSLKTCLPLPVSAPFSQAVGAEEVTSGYATATSQVICDSFQISEGDHDPVEHVDEELRRHRSQHLNREDESEEEEELSKQEEEDHTSPLDPVKSFSPLTPHSNSLAAMSRIYKLETGGLRSGLCLRERTADVPSVHLVKVKPLVSNARRGDSKTFSGEDICGVQAIQRQIERFQLREQETLKSCGSPNTLLKDRGTKGHQSPRGVLKHQVKDDEKTPENDEETSKSNPNASPRRVRSPTSQLKETNQATTVAPSLLRSQSPDSTLKRSDYAPTPASPSPSRSPSVSPSPTPSPTLFSVRSASGGQVKRGVTITIAPKKPAGSGVTGPSTGSTAGGSKPSNGSSEQDQAASAAAEPVKKKYPTVEEIEVVGGYQNLDKSCLVKNRETPKR